MSQRHPKTRFTDAAHAYRAHRPGYPPGVFDALFEGLGDASQLLVADIGAGTGISSALLAERVAKVYAVEPNETMRAQAEPLRNVVWSNGTAEHTGLARKSVDLALAFQAFHWFDVGAAFEEFARIARRRIGMVQYERDERHSFTHAYGDIVRKYATDDTEDLRARTLERFATLAGAHLRRTDVPSEQALNVDGLIGRAASASYLPRSGARADALYDELRDLYARFELNGTVALVMQVHVLCADL